MSTITFCFLFVCLSRTSSRVRLQSLPSIRDWTKQFQSKRIWCLSQLVHASTREPKEIWQFVPVSQCLPLMWRTFVSCPYKMYLTKLTARSVGQSVCPSLPYISQWWIWKERKTHPAHIYTDRQYPQTPFSNAEVISQTHLYLFK